MKMKTRTRDTVMYIYVSKDSSKIVRSLAKSSGDSMSAVIDSLIYKSMHPVKRSRVLATTRAPNRTRRAASSRN